MSKLLKNLSREPVYARICNKQVNWKHQKVEIWANFKQQANFK